VGLNTRMLATDTDVTWDQRTRHYLAGTIVDIPPGSALEAAYGGPGNLVDLNDQDALSLSNGGGITAAGPDDTPPDDQGGSQQ
jgi:hypothetical protein